MDFSNFPAMAPPPGTESNFTNPHTLGPTIIALNAVFIALMIIVVSIRLYSRGVLVGNFGSDDYTCILAALGSILSTGFMINNIHHGYGSHLWDIRAISLTPQALRELTGMAIIYPLTMLLVKLTIALLYLRLFSIHKTFRCMVYLQISFNAAFYTALTIWQIYELVHCTSPTSLTSKVCTANEQVNLATACFNVATDIFLLALPVPIVMNLMLEMRKKIGLLAIFSAGAAATIVSFVRLIYIAKTLDSSDLLYNAAFTSTFTIVEMNVGIIAASMSSLPIALSRGKVFWNSTFSSLRSNLFSTRSRGSAEKSGYASSHGSASDQNPGEFIQLEEGRARRFR